MRSLHYCFFLIKLLCLHVCVAMSITCICTHFRDNFGTTFITFSPSESESIFGGSIVNSHLPSNLLPDLQNVSGQLHSFRAELIQFRLQSAASVHKGCYIFACLRRLIYRTCLKWLPSSPGNALGGAHDWSTDASIVRCSPLC